MSAENDDTNDTEIRARALDQAISELPARYKEPLILTALQGMSQREAAEQLGLTVKATELRIHRARKRLLEVLRRNH
ncbi:MAG: RNA polymerase sigma factor [Steroidobacteraceae bacterium]